MQPNSTPRASSGRLLRLRLGLLRPKGLALAALLLGGSLFAAWLVLSAPLERARYDHLIGQRQLEDLNRNLAAAKAETVFFGDSHAVFMSEKDPFCGKAVLNAGVGGITTTGYRAFMEKLALPSRIPMGILSIGTNSARRKFLPRNVSRFGVEAEAIIAKLLKRTEFLVVFPLPPIAEDVMPTFDRAAVAGFSDKLAALCHLPHCAFIDPYQAIRSDDPLVARAGTMEPDGVHLVNYARARRAAEEAICR